ncbi:hypothetical protein ACH5RR_023718 [Cinchona calisaya]|uniref:Uncharacterized protein n=1 Tax=Cinchona calisaya TaxID=153742 RepID=A0ABD2ZBG4_9GENT
MATGENNIVASLGFQYTTPANLMQPLLAKESLAYGGGAVALDAVGERKGNSLHPWCSWIRGFPLLSSCSSLSCPLGSCIDLNRPISSTFKVLSILASDGWLLNGGNDRDDIAVVEEEGFWPPSLIVLSELGDEAIDFSLHLEELLAKTSTPSINVIIRIFEKLRRNGKLLKEGRQNLELEYKERRRNLEIQNCKWPKVFTNLQRGYL